MKRRTLILLAIAATLCIGTTACKKDNPDADEWIDLGLPSGLLWASHNIGASTPENYGGYYAWGETYTKSTYNWSTYTYYADSNITKYTPTDGRTTLSATDDAATQWNSKAHTPTVTEWEELTTHCTGQWTTQNGIHGYLFTAPNGNTLFLPATGSHWDDETGDPDTFGTYWTSTIGEDSTNAWYFFFYAEDAYMSTYGIRADGRSVRPVRPAK